MTHVPPHNLEAERSVLGAVLLSERILPSLLAVDLLRSEHFYRPSHASVFAAMASLYDRSEPVDALTVSDELDRRGQLEELGGTAFVHSLPSTVPAAGNAAHYAEIIVRAAGFRARLEAAQAIQEAALNQDAEALATAEGMLTAGVEQRGLSREARREELFAHGERRESVATFPWPFPSLNEWTGGMWPGHLTILAGISQHGKSVLADQLLDTVASHGAKAAAYLTEMTSLERDLRLVARRTGIPLLRLMRGQLRDGEHPAYLKAIEALPFEIVPAGTMSAREVGRDIRRRRLDVAVVDLLNVVCRTKTSELDEDIAYLAGLANDTGCHIVGCQHLNRSRLTGHPYPPEPTQGDIRGSGAIFDLATNVLSVYRRERLRFSSSGVEEPTGKPGDEAVLNFLKVKNGIDGRMDVVFDGSRMSFKLPPVAQAVAA